MKYRIDPTVDFAFKALLGSERNKNLLVDFLNAVLKPLPEQIIIAVDLPNTHSEKEYPSDKLSVMDIKATDGAGLTYQVEIQLSVPTTLSARMAYTLCDVYASQLSGGEFFGRLKPVISIWVVRGVFFQDSPLFHHRFQLYDAEHDVLLSDHLSLHVLELEKWNKSQVEEQLDRWVKFLREGKDLDDESLPEYMQTEEMRQAMNTLRQISEKERNYHRYQSRVNHLRERMCLEAEWDQAMLERGQAMLERGQAMLERGQAIQREQVTARELDLEMQRRQATVRELNLVRQREQAAVQRELALLEEVKKLKKDR